MCERWLQCPWHRCPALFLNRTNWEDAKSFYTWHYPKQKEWWHSWFQFWVKKKFHTVVRGWRDGVETEREKLGGAAESERGREAKTEGQVRVIFGRKCLPLEVFEINCVFAFPCSWDWWRDWQYVSSNMPTYCSPVLPAWPYSPNGVPLPRLSPVRTNTHTHTNKLIFTT